MKLETMLFLHNFITKQKITRHVH